MQQWEHFPCYLPNSLWEKVMNEEVQPTSLLDLLFRHLLKLGLCNPSEMTQAVLVALMTLRQNAATRDESLTQLRTLYLNYKAQLHSKYSKVKPEEKIVGPAQLTADPCAMGEDFLQKAFDGEIPAAPKISMQDVMGLAFRVPLRSTNLSARPVPLGVPSSSQRFMDIGGSVFASAFGALGAMMTGGFPGHDDPLRITYASQSRPQAAVPRACPEARPPLALPAPAAPAPGNPSGLQRLWALEDQRLQGLQPSPEDAPSQHVQGPGNDCPLPGGQGQGGAAGLEAGARLSGDHVGGHQDAKDADHGRKLPAVSSGEPLPKAIPAVNHAGQNLPKAGQSGREEEGNSGQKMSLKQSLGKMQALRSEKRPREDVETVEERPVKGLAGSMKRPAAACKKPEAAPKKVVPKGKSKAKPADSAKKKKTSVMKKKPAVKKGAGSKKGAGHHKEFTSGKKSLLKKIPKWHRDKFSAGCSACRYVPSCTISCWQKRGYEP